MKKIGIFFCLCLYVVGAIGGFGYAAHCGAWLIAVAVLILAVMAWPTARRFAKQLMD